MAKDCPMWRWERGEMKSALAAVVDNPDEVQGALNVLIKLVDSIGEGDDEALIEVFEALILDCGSSLMEFSLNLMEIERRVKKLKE